MSIREPNMMLELTNLEATQQLAAAFAATLRVPAVVLLSGTLGSGKTSFVQGFFRALGFKHIVRSPTFAIVESYSFAEVNAELAERYPDGYIHHFDFYRINDAKALEMLGIREYLNGMHVVFIEWPAVGELLGIEADLRIELDYLELEQGRKFQCSAESVLGREWLGAVLQFNSELK